MSIVKKGHQISVHYVGTFADGKEFDSSRTRGAPISFEVGAGQMIKGFDAAVAGMTIGETKKVTLKPAEAYGELDPDRRQTVPRTAFAPGFELEEGAPVQGRSPNGAPFVAKIEAINDDGVVLDLNHPMAGKVLNFDIELLSIDNEATEE